MGSSTISVIQKALVRHAMFTQPGSAEDVINFYSFRYFKTNTHLLTIIGFLQHILAFTESS